MTHSEINLMLFAINKFAKRKIDSGNWKDIMSLVDMIEDKHTNGYDRQIKMSLKTIDESSTEAEFGAYKYECFLNMNQSTMYYAKSPIREVAVIKAAGDFCKDYLIKQQMEAEEKKHKKKK